MEIKVQDLVIKIEGESINILNYTVTCESAKKYDPPNKDNVVYEIKNLSISILRSL